MATQEAMKFNLKNKTGKSDVECVKDVFGKMGAGQSCDDIVDVVLTYLWLLGSI